MSNRVLEPFGTTIFSEMTQLAIDHQAINLSQGFPDFEGPEAILEAAISALKNGHNQYQRSRGALPLVHAIADQRAALYGTSFDPMTEVGIYSGATEGLAPGQRLLAYVDDEVVVFEPVYDSYPAIIALAQAKLRTVTLEFPDFGFSTESLDAVINERTKVILLNTPHNPTGKVFSQEELELIADRAQKNDLTVVTDEVYEHLYFDKPHVPMASIDGMRDRTLSISSSGKTYSYTGWKIGWATGPAHLISAAQRAHQFLTFATAAPLQHAIASAIKDTPAEFYSTLRSDFQNRRDHLLETLQTMGLTTSTPEGGYFILADFSAVFDGDDVDYARYLTKELKVAAIPPSCFYPHHPESGKKLVRFAFCKTMDTLRKARGRLCGSV